MKILLIVFLHIFTTCEFSDSKNKKPLPFFRRSVEEVGDYDDTSDSNTRKTEDPQSNLVSFLVKNVKEIFRDPDNQNIDNDVENDFYGAYTLKYRPTINYRYTSKQNQSSATETDDVMKYENLSLTPMPFIYPNRPVIMSIQENKLLPIKSLQSKSKDLLFLGNSKENEVGAGVIYESSTTNISDTGAVDIFSLLTIESTSSKVVTEPERRSCIQCNNVDDERCGNPKNKLLVPISALYFTACKLYKHVQIDSNRFFSLCLCQSSTIYFPILFFQDTINYMRI